MRRQSAAIEALLSSNSLTRHEFESFLAKRVDDARHSGERLPPTRIHDVEYDDRAGTDSTPDILDNRVPVGRDFRVRIGLHIPHDRHPTRLAEIPGQSHQLLAVGGPEMNGSALSCLT